MITFTNTQQHPQMPFAEYLAMPGYSHSFLKYNVSGTAQYIEPTDKMRLGTMVDAIITGGKGADIADPQYQYAKIIAAYMVNKMPYLAKLKKQVPCTGIATYAGLSMLMKTLPDFILPGIATVEMKVCDIKSADAEKAMAYAGYDNQCFIERSLAGVPDSYILIFCRKSKDIWFRKRECLSATDWLCNHILNFGTC